MSYLTTGLCVLLSSSAYLAASVGGFGGSPVVRLWTPEEYSGGEQIFDVAKLPSGELLLADITDRAVHRFDGAQWRTFPLPAEPLRMALGPDPVSGEQRVWLAASSDLGWLEEVDDPARSLRFVSLLDQVPAEFSQITRYDAVEVADDAIYFGQNSVLLRWDGQALRGWAPPDGEGFGWPQWVDGRLFVGARGGQYELVGDDLVMRPEMGASSADIVPFGDGRLALFRYDGFPKVELFDPSTGRLEPFPGPLNEMLGNESAQDVEVLPDGRLAVSAPHCGVLIVDRDGSLAEQIDEAAGIYESETYRLLYDDQSILWVTLTEGVASVDLSAPVEMFARGNSVSGFLTDIDWFGDALVVTSFDGVFVYREALADLGFVAVAQLEGVDSWQVFAHQGRCLVLTDQGLHELLGLDGGPLAVRRLAESGPLDLAATSRPDRVLAVGNQRLQMYDAGLQAGDPWQILYRIDLPNYAGAVWPFGDDRFWVVGDGTVTLVEIGDLDEPPQLSPILSGEEWYGIDQVDGRWTIYGKSGVYELTRPDDPARVESWKPDVRFGELDLAQLTRHPTGYGLETDREGGIWVSSTEGFWRYVLDPERQVYRSQEVGWTTRRLGFSEVDPRDALNVWFEERGVVARFDGRAASPALLETEIEPRIRRTLPDEGLPADEAGASDSAPMGAASVDSLPYSDRTLRFEFAVPYLRDWQQTEYRYQLIGFEDDWSAWGRETRRDYTGLREGTYRFRVAARQGDLALGEATYRFVIRPPWFRSRGMILLYLLAILSSALGAGLAWRRRARALHEAEAQERARLEALVVDRTAELQRVNSELERQAVTDSLTGLHNRRFLRESLPHDLAKMRRSAAVGSVEQGLAILLVDVDLFKGINDRYGHGAGDDVLREVARRLERARRQGDYLVRWGGDEFLVVTHLASRREAAETAERLHREIGDGQIDLSQFGAEGPLEVTVSIGFSVLPLRETPDLEEEPERSLEIADRCLYLIKESGRDGWAGLCACEEGLELGRGEALHLDPDDSRLDLRTSRVSSASMTSA